MVVGEHILSEKEKWTLCVVWPESTEKFGMMKTFSLQTARLFPQFFTLLCNFVEYNSLLGNFNKDPKDGKSLSSKYILSSSGSNLISVKRRNKGKPMFWNEAS